VSKRRDLEARIRSLGEIKEIMSAMKNLSLMETHRLDRVLDTQRRVLANIESTAADFLFFHPHLLSRQEESCDVYLLVGSERGFCGDFNELLLRALDDNGGVPERAALVVIGGKLANKIRGDTRVTAFLDGASVMEEVDFVLANLAQTLTRLSSPRPVSPPLRLIVFHNDPDNETAGISVLGPFKERDLKNPHFAYAPLLNLKPESFLRRLAGQYLEAALQELLYRSLAAENRLRLRHMDSAVRRLERTSTELARRRSTLRQEEITEEIEVIMLSLEGGDSPYTARPAPLSPMRKTRPPITDGSLTKTQK
jgi:F-type H+-transporting ATPase subunit gamma